MRLPEPFLRSAVLNRELTLVSGSALTMQKGHVSLTPYSVVEQLVMRGEVELV